MTTECKGCCTYEGMRKCKFIRQGDKCPCRMCLVKGVCIRECDEFSTFSVTYRS